MRGSFVEISYLLCGSYRRPARLWPVGTSSAAILTRLHVFRAEKCALRYPEGIYTPVLIQKVYVRAGGGRADDPDAVTELVAPGGGACRAYRRGEHQHREHASGNKCVRERPRSLTRSAVPAQVFRLFEDAHVGSLIGDQVENVPEGKHRIVEFVEARWIKSGVSGAPKAKGTREV